MSTRVRVSAPSRFQDELKQWEARRSPLRAKRHAASPRITAPGRSTRASSMLRKPEARRRPPRPPSSRTFRPCLDASTPDADFAAAPQALAPLCEAQSECVRLLQDESATRPLPAGLVAPAAETASDAGRESEDGSRALQPMRTKQEFRAWFAGIEGTLESERASRATPHSGSRSAQAHDARALAAHAAHPLQASAPRVSPAAASRPQAQKHADYVGSVGACASALPLRVRG